jgi:hypothetical protein
MFTRLAEALLDLGAHGPVAVAATAEIVDGGASPQRMHSSNMTRKRP